MFLHLNLLSVFPSNLTETTSWREELNSRIEQLEQWTGWGQVGRNKEDIIAIRQKTDSNKIDIYVIDQDIAKLFDLSNTLKDQIKLVSF